MIEAMAKLDDRFFCILPTVSTLGFGTDRKVWPWEGRVTKADPGHVVIESVIDPTKTVCVSEADLFPNMKAALTAYQVFLEFHQGDLENELLRVRKAIGQ